MRTQDDITDEVIKRPRSKTGWIDCSRWYEWGDQLTAAFVKLDDDLPIEIKSGCGSNTPYLDKDGNPRFPSEDISDFEKSCNALDKYLEQDHGDWIRASYDRQQNPLPGLRKRVGGTWFFQRKETN